MESTVKPVVEYFFDASCPWSYLALNRVREAAIRTGGRVVYRPVLVTEVLRLAKSTYPTDRSSQPAARARYEAKDLADWARYCGVTLRRPEPWPLRPEWAQRGAVVADECGHGMDYIPAVFAALFADNRDTSDLEVVKCVAAESGLDTPEFTTRIQESRTLQQVNANTAELVARGGFGTPTLLVGDDLYFGNDRMPLVEVSLARHGGMRLVLPGEHGA